MKLLEVEKLNIKFKIFKKIFNKNNLAKDIFFNIANKGFKF